MITLDTIIEKFEKNYLRTNEIFVKKNVNFNDKN